MAPDEAHGHIVEDIINGQDESGWPAVGEVYFSSTCSGTLITPDYVLTAAHCYDSGASAPFFFTGTYLGDPSGIQTPIDGEIIHPSRDLMLVHLSQARTDIVPLTINTGGLPATGTICTIIGWGDSVVGGGGGVKKSATVVVSSASSTEIGVTPDSGIAGLGDSGGPLLCPSRMSQIVGVTYSTDEESFSEYTTTDLTWIYNSLASHGFTPFYQGYLGANYGLPPTNWATISGDFNGDGKTDYARVGATGASVFHADHLGPNGVFDEAVFQDYTPLNFGNPATNWPAITGDFNGDGKTDYVRVGATGAWIFYASSSGPYAGFAAPVFQDYTLSSPPLNFGSPPTDQIFTGDFNGDGKTDYVRATPTGAWIFYADSRGGNFNTAVFQDFGGLNFSPAADWPVITGDFNGDGHQDYAFVGATGAWIFYGKSGGGFNSATFQDFNGLNFGNPATNWATFTGDFNHDGKTDYIRSGATGAYVFFGSSSGIGVGQFQSYAPYNFGTPATSSPAIAGDFNGDGKTDYARLTATGAFLYISNGTNIFTQWFQDYDGLNVGTPSEYPIIVGNFTGTGRSSYAWLGGTRAYIFAQF